MWASVATLLKSPSQLFVLINIFIVTIVLISRLFPSHKTQTHHHQLARAPSLLDRVKSIDFSHYNFTPTNTELEFHHLVRAPSGLLDRVKSINFSSFQFPKFSPEPDYYAPAQPEPVQQLYRAPSLLERVKSIDFTSLYRSDAAGRVNPETEEHDSVLPRSDHPRKVGKSKSEVKVTQRKVNKKMKKSNSEIFRREGAEGEEELERRRPETTKAEKTKAVGETGDVDAKADDFINRFKDHLRLQRLDSFLRYKEMLSHTK